MTVLSNKPDQVVRYTCEHVIEQGTAKMSYNCMSASGVCGETVGVEVMIIKLLLIP